MHLRLFLCSLAALMLFSCTYEKGQPLQTEDPARGYPAEISEILVKKCATSGCHNDISKDAASGLSLSSWSRLLEGGRNGPAVVPYRPDYSTLLFYVNSFEDLGPALQPRMPFNQPSLTRKEVLLLRDWISKGAPGGNGTIPFADNPQRKKIYVANQGCDVVMVFDSETGKMIRAVDVGNSPASVESPHMIKVSPDGEYWYVVFYNGTVVQRFRTSDDSYAGEIPIGAGTWNTFVVSPDSRKGFAVDWSSSGQIVYMDLEKMQKTVNYPSLKNPHGIAVNKTFTTLYITAQTGNYIYKIDITDPLSPEEKMIVLEKGQPLNYNSSLDPHEIMLSPDEKEYFVSCQASDEVRVMKTSNDSLLAVIKTGNYPLEMAFSESRPYLFVTCMEDSAGVPAFTKGSVAVIDYKTHSLVRKVYGFYQPHGIAVDDVHGRVYVASRNKSSQGPQPHHTTACGGRNGFLKYIVLGTLELHPSYKVEVSVDPYAVAIRK
jgi:YVTN family beta-propeller protein